MVAVIRDFSGCGVFAQHSACTHEEYNAPGTQFAPNLATIGVEWARKAPGTIPAGARAAAQPFQPTGRRITLYLDRLMPIFESRSDPSAILGHILAHEIGHILMGHNAHSAGGLMKAFWTAYEQEDMSRRLVQFSERDAETLRQAVDRRFTVLASSR